MQLHEFLGQVQHRARLASVDEALRVTRLTLETLGERLAGNEPAKLAAQLPAELKHLLEDKGGIPEPFGCDAFLARISLDEHVDLPRSVFHVRAVLSVLADAVSPGALEHMRAQLPEDYQRLFDSGAEGRMKG
jgi:uncharacterized protein (DUF2267 family)